jgi:anti-sigma regulatory factor (Ser/Thr protein kinase)/putative methionine-R-sulfoxide reductase with GAF domain
MPAVRQRIDAPPRGAGQIVLRSPGPHVVPDGQARGLYGLSDPTLCELGLDELLDELLVRVREALAVDTVAILLLDAPTRQLVARAAKGLEEEVERGVRIPIGRGFAGRIAAERAPVVVADVDDADILNPILREKGVRSLLGVPLIVEGQLIGVLHVGSLRPRRFGERDVAVLEVAAARVAPGIERARLALELAREHEVAIALQRSLLPRRLASPIGVSVAARYLPARDEVSGDWYDVIELPRGLLGVAIGDVVGHGVDAAALMGQLRTALHCYAIEGHPPGRVLELTDRYLQTVGACAMATAAYAVFDTETSALRLASAGHPPPVVLGGGGASAVEIAPGAPLGALAFSRYSEHELALASGEMLLLYTDGLIERHGEPLDEGISRLCRAVQGASAADAACALAVEDLVPIEGPTDDVAVIAVQSTVMAAELRLRLPAEPESLGRLRRALRRWLHERGVSGADQVEVMLASGEACANAIEHAYSPGPATFELSARCTGDEVSVVVRDSGRWRPSRGQDRGRGLKIIAAAMDTVELNRNPTGTEVVMRRRIENRCGSRT